MQLQRLLEFLPLLLLLQVICQINNIMKRFIFTFFYVCITINLFSQFSLPTFHASYVNPSFVTSVMILRYELGNSNSYSGTGNTVFDLMGNTNATIYGNPVYSSSSSGNLNLVGSSSQFLYTNTSIASLFTGNSASTSLFMWVFPTGNGVILDERGTAHPGPNWFDSQIEMVSGTLKFSMWSYQFGTSLISSSIATPLNKWYYIGIVYDENGRTLTAYVNGQNAGTYTSFTRATPYSNGYGLFYGIGYPDATNQGDGTNGDFKLGAFHVYKKALTQAEISLNYNVTKVNYDIIQSGLVANLINPPNSGSTWTDASGNGNNATLNGSPTYASANGGGYTTSSTSYISLPNNLSSTFTVSVACSLNPSKFWAALWGNESWSASKGYIAYLLSNSTMNFGSPPGPISISLSGININTVHIWDFVVNGTSYTLYIDGVSVGTGTFTAPSGGLSTTGLYFGARHGNDGTSYTDALPGTYYSMRVYNRALSADEINTNFSVLRGNYGL